MQVYVPASGQQSLRLGPGLLKLGKVVGAALAEGVVAWHAVIHAMHIVLAVVHGGNRVFRSRGGGVLPEFNHALRLGGNFIDVVFVLFFFMGKHPTGKPKRNRQQGQNQNHLQSIVNVKQISFVYHCECP